MARKRFQSGMLTKEGKRRKVWVLRWRENVLGDDGRVQRIRRSQVIGTLAELPTRRDAQNRVEERLRPVNAGTSKPESGMLFGSFVETQWNVLVLPNFKASTQHGYKIVLAKHVLPEWKSSRLRDIERLAVQQWVAEKFRRGSGWQVVRNSWTLLSSVLESAVEFGYLENNPARGVRFPQKVLGRKPTIITGADFLKLLAQLSEPYKTMVSLIAATGLRVGELLALRWAALDLPAGTLSVRESVFEGTFSAPKTQRAFRTIPLGPRAVKVLTEHRTRVSRTEASDLVFGNRQGNPLRQTKLLQRVLQPAAEAAALGRVTWHQFRHIHSSLLNDLRVPVKIAQEQLGHAAIATTLGIYTHVVEASHRSAVEAVEERLFEVDGTGRKLPEPQTVVTAASATVH